MQLSADENLQFDNVGLSSFSFTLKFQYQVLQRTLKNIAKVMHTVSAIASRNRFLLSLNKTQ